MTKVWRVLWREYKETMRSKASLFGFLLFPLMMLGGAILYGLTKDRVEVRDKRLAVVDRSGVLGEALLKAAGDWNANEVRDPATGKQLRPAYYLELVDPGAASRQEQLLALSDRVRRGEIHAFLEIGQGVVHPSLDRSQADILYYGMNPFVDELRDWVAGPINQELRRLRLAAAGIDKAVAEDLFEWLHPQALGLVSAAAGSGAKRYGKTETILIPIALPLLMYMLTLVCAIPHLYSVVEEKSQRVVEMVLGCIKPFPFMMGKLLGGVAISLTAGAVYLLAGALALQHRGLGQYIPYHLLPWFLAFLLSAVTMYGAMCSALGSICSDSSEAQSMLLPALIPIAFPMMVQIPVALNAQSAWATGLSLVPLFSPILMLVRQGTPGGVPGWQPWGALAGCATFAVLFVWIGSRIFRMGLLMQGGVPSLGKVLRWAIRG